MSVHLQKDIDKLKKMILSLCATVEDALRRAINSLENRDAALADEVIQQDASIDLMEVSVEEECLKILALHQPVAIDLRFIIAVLKINNDLERIGDLAVNIAEHVPHLVEHGGAPMPLDFAGMATKAQAMLKQALDALVNMDAALARQVCAADDEVDDLNRRMIQQIKAGIVSNPDRIDPLTRLLSASRHLERVADHATNIAEDVVYMIQGEIVRHSGGAYRAKHGSPSH